MTFNPSGFRHVRTLKSGSGVVCYAQEGNAFVALSLDWGSGAGDVVGRVEFEGFGDMRAARARISGLVDSYAAGN